MNIYDSLLLLPIAITLGILYWDLFTYDWDALTRPVKDQ